MGLTKLMRRSDNSPSKYQRIGEREQHERKKFVFKVENALLRFERLLPAGETKKRK